MNSGLFEKPRLIKGGKKDSFNSVRYVNVLVSRDVIAEFFINSGRMFSVTRGIPKDAELIRFGFDQQKGYFVATFEHPSFDMVAIDKEIPTLDVEYTAYVMVEGDNEVVQDQKA